MFMELKVSEITRIICIKCEGYSSSEYEKKSVVMEKNVNCESDQWTHSTGHTNGHVHMCI